MTVRDLLSRFLRWWLGELEACIPLRARQAWRWLRPTLVATPMGGMLHLRRREGEAWQELGDIELDPQDPSAGSEAYRRAIVAARMERAELVLALGAEQALRTFVSLPLATRENIRAVLGFEIDRYTPFRAEEVVFDYAIKGTDKAAKQIQVELVTVPRARLESLLEKLSQLGTQPARVTIAEDTGPRLDLNLVPQDGTTRNHRLLTRINLALGATALALLITAAMLPLLQARRELAAYEAKLAEARAAAEQVEALQKRIAETREREDFLIKRRNATPAFTVVVEELARILDDRSWIEELRLDGDRLFLAGYAGSAAELIPALERSDRFSGVKFSAPVTPDAAAGRERFTISATVVSSGGGS